MAPRGQTDAEEIPASDARELKVGREIQADVTSSFEKKSEEFDSCRLTGEHDACMWVFAPTA